MFTLCDPRPTHHCQGYSRRDFLRIGGLGAGSLALPNLWGNQASADIPSGVLTGKSIVLLFLQGGPPHIEFFDPKMTAPHEFHSITGEVKTKIPGVTFGATFPKLASLTDRFTIVRSYGSGNAGHSYEDVTTAGNPTKASISSIYARVRGNNHATTGMPTNVLLLPEAVRDGLKLGGNFETSALPTLTQPGQLGPTYAAFNPSGGGQLQKDLELAITPNQLSDRRQLLGALDGLRRSVDASGSIHGLDAYQQQAFEMITRGVKEAFDLKREDATTLALYDTSRLFDMRDLTRWNDMRRTTNLLGRQMLLARRLCEAGCGFVTVSDCGWDYHANGNSPKNMAGIYPMGGQVDHAVSAFLEDVRERGLSDKILLVVTGEMGRSPRINNNGGRDHYGELTPLLLAGGGLRMGQIIGQTDSQAAKAITTPYRAEHLFATMLHTLFDVGKLRLAPHVSTELLRFAESIKPIDNLM